MSLTSSGFCGIIEEKAQGDVVDEESNNRRRKNMSELQETRKSNQDRV